MPSIGTAGDRYDNARAETGNGYYKAELIRGPVHKGRAWETVEDVELFSLGRLVGLVDPAGRGRGHERVRNDF